MTAERLPMRKLREVMRLKFEVKLSGRAIALSCALSPATVSDYLGRIKLAKLDWPLPAELDDDEALTRRLFPQEGKPAASRPEPDWCVIHHELKRKHAGPSLPSGFQHSDVSMDINVALSMSMFSPNIGTSFAIFEGTLVAPRRKCATLFCRGPQPLLVQSRRCRARHFRRRSC